MMEGRREGGREEGRKGVREGEEMRRDGREMRNKGHDDDCYKGEGRRGGLFKERWRVGEVRKEGRRE